MMNGKFLHCKKKKKRKGKPANDQMMWVHDKHVSKATSELALLYLTILKMAVFSSRMKCLSIIFVCFCCASFTASLSIFRENEDFLQNLKYLSHEELTKLLNDLADQHPDLVKLHNIGHSVKNRTLWAVEISRNIPERALLTPMFKYVANMHGDETVGYQLLVYLSQYLINNYEHDKRVKRIIDTTDVFLMPSMNPDGFANAQVSFVFRKWLYHFDFL